MAFISGILLLDVFPFLWKYPAFVLPPFLLIYWLVWFKWKTRSLHGILVLGLIVYLGGLIKLLKEISPNEDNHQVDAFTAVVVSGAEDRGGYLRFEADLRQGIFDSCIVHPNGSIYLYIKEDSLSRGLYPVYGDIVLVSHGFTPISAPKIPFEFDFKKHLSRQHIFGQAFVGLRDVQVIGHDPPAILIEYALSLRAKFLKDLERFIPADREAAVLSALVLGVKDKLGPEVKSSYISAGAMHVLAVSGLHVGVIYLILSIAFRPIKKEKYGRWLFLLTSWAAIWAYVLITGFTASVLRAGVMLSIVVLSEVINRRSNIYNSLSIAAFLLLLYEPNMIYSVGFQLSFAAVIGIVTIYPKIYGLVKTRYWVSSYFWSLFCVSVAAQLSTFPLSIYYFNQFPTYSLLSGLVVLPFIPIVLGGGIVLLTLGSLVPFLGSGLAWLIGWATWIVNELIVRIEALPGAVLNWLYLDEFEVIIIYAGLISFLIVIETRKFIPLLVGGVCIIVFSLYGDFVRTGRLLQKKVVFIRSGRNIYIDLIKGDKAILLVSGQDKDLSQVLEYRINPYRLASGLPDASSTWEYLSESGYSAHLEEMDLILWGGKKILILKSNQIGSNYPDDLHVVCLTGPVDFPASGLIADHVLLGGGFASKENEQLSGEEDGSVHDLKEEGYWEVDLK